MKLEFLRTGEPDLDRLKLGLIILAGASVLIAVVSGYFGFSAALEATEKEAALATISKSREQRDADLRTAQASNSAESAGGIQAIRHFQESLNKLAGAHEVNVTGFQSTTALAPMKSSYGISDAPGWGMAMVDVNLHGSSRSVFSFIRELAYVPYPFEIEKVFFEPSLPSPNGGTQLNVLLNLKVFAKEQQL